MIRHERMDDYVDK